MKLKIALEIINKRDSKQIYGKGNKKAHDKLYPHVKTWEDDFEWIEINKLMEFDKL